MNKHNYSLGALLVIFVMAGCSSAPSPAELMRQKAVEYKVDETLANQWEQGEKLVFEGNKKIKAADSDIKSAEGEIKSAKNRIQSAESKKASGQQDVTRGQSMMEHAETTFKLRNQSR
ncbi:hypothetical protein CK910_06845 [Aeromonas sp. CA23]|uniref:hypothetical protein n=1 Tax=Aeromonas sp. CA23 TaxID=2033032 RepID=UPI000BFC2F7E|nr:hypothetical protein [Aeromonas sp. CA23]ATL98238.1 hypothetical protein CK910_06845 [Aeromonas sp. CA23]